MIQKKQTLFFVCIIISIIVLIDRVSKELALLYLKGESPISLIPNVLYLHFAWNSGVAFGFFANHQWVITLLVSAIILFILYSFSKVHPKYYFSLGLILGGAIGNLVDRLVYDLGVVDFFSIPFFAIFNIADIAITFGVILLILQKETNILRFSLKKKKKKINSEY